VKPINKNTSVEVKGQWKLLIQVWRNYTLYSAVTMKLDIRNTVEQSGLHQ